MGLLSRTAAGSSRGRRDGKPLAIFPAQAERETIRTRPHRTPSAPSGQVRIGLGPDEFRREPDSDHTVGPRFGALKGQD